MTTKSTFIKAKVEFIKDLSTLMTQRLKSLPVLISTLMEIPLPSVITTDSTSTASILKEGNGKRLYASRSKTITV